MNCYRVVSASHCHVTTYECCAYTQYRSITGWKYVNERLCNITL